ncbi:glycosyl hydrolase family 25 [Mycoplasma sp. CAG:956]|nr:glycosyl hydrolase family 25 [Mycoplasma sp. CAG:956]
MESYEYGYDKNEKRKMILASILDMVNGGALIAGPLLTANRSICDWVDSLYHRGDTENTYGYDKKPIIKINQNNFYVFNISNATDLVCADTYASFLDKKANDNTNSNVSYAVVLHTKACTLGEIYKDIDMIQAFLARHQVELPVYLSIDELMENKKLDTKQKEELVSAFIKKFDMSKGYLGISGKDSNLVKFNEYVMDITDYDTYVIQDSEEIKYTGSHNMIKYLDGSITASDWLANSIASKQLNKSENLVYSAVYTIQDNEDINSVALKFGLSVNDLKKYNNIKFKTPKSGDKILIPNLYVTVDPKTNDRAFTYAVASGIDISLFQGITDWNVISKTSDFVILRASSACLSKDDASLAPKLVEVNNLNKPFGLYFCIEGNTVLATDAFEARFRANIANFEAICNANGININKDNIPLFIDFERFEANTDHLEIMRSAVRVANELGYSKVGLYANSSTTKRISQEYQSKGTSLANENTILWLAGGPNYLTSSYVEAKRAERNEENQERKANNESTIDTPLGQEIGFAIEDLEEQENTSFEGVIPAIRQVGNYVNNTGAANSDGVADYNYLYSDNLFGNDAFGETPDSNPNTIESTIKSVDDYRNVTNLLPSVLAHPDGALLGAITSYVFLLWTKQRFSKFFKKRDLIAPSTVVARETIKLAKHTGAALKRARR